MGWPREEFVTETLCHLWGYVASNANAYFQVTIRRFIRDEAVIVLVPMGAVLDEYALVFVSHGARLDAPRQYLDTNTL